MSSSSITSQQPIFLTSALSALAPAMGAVPGNPNIVQAISFLKSPAACGQITAAYGGGSSPSAASAMEGFFARIDSPPAALRTAWRGLQRQRTAKGTPNFSPALSSLADAIAASCRNASGAAFVSVLIYLIGNGSGSSGGKLGAEEKRIEAQVVSALSVHRPGSVPEHLWDMALRRCLFKWMVAHGVGDILERRSDDEWRLLADAFGRKVKKIMGYGIPTTVIMKIIARESEGTIDYVAQRYPRQIALKALTRIDPKAMAIKTLEARQAAFAFVSGHPNRAMRKLASTIAVVCMKGGAVSAESAQKMAEEVIEATSAARAYAEAHGNSDIRRNAGTIASVTARRGMKGARGGRCFAEKIVESALAAHSVVDNLKAEDIAGIDPALAIDVEAIGKYAHTVATAAVNRGTLGAERGEALARATIEAVIAVIGLVRKNPNKHIKALEGTIALACADIGLCGREAGLKFAQDTFDAIEGGRAFCLGRGDEVIRGIAQVVTDRIPQRNVRGREKGRKFAEGMADAAKAAMDIASAHPDDDIRRNALTLVHGISKKGLTSAKSAEKYALAIIKAAIAARDFIREHPERAVRTLDGTVLSNILSRGLADRKAAIAYAQSFIASQLAIIRDTLRDRVLDFMMENRILIVPAGMDAAAAFLATPSAEARAKLPPIILFPGLAPAERAAMDPASQPIFSEQKNMVRRIVADENELFRANPRYKIDYSSRIEQFWNGILLHHAESRIPRAEGRELDEIFNASIRSAMLHMRFNWEDGKGWAAYHLHRAAGVAIKLQKPVAAAILLETAAAIKAGLSKDRLNHQTPFVRDVLHLDLNAETCAAWNGSLPILKGEPPSHGLAFKRAAAYTAAGARPMLLAGTWLSAAKGEGDRREAANNYVRAAFAMLHAKERDWHQISEALSNAAGRLRKVKGCTAKAGRLSMLSRAARGFAAP